MVLADTPAEVVATTATQPPPSQQQLPLLQRSPCDGANERVRADIARLEKELEELEGMRAARSINESCVSEEAIQHFIALLHEYNELKDAGQALFGKLAELEGTLVKDIYARFDLNLDD